MDGWERKGHSNISANHNLIGLARAGVKSGKGNQAMVWAERVDPNQSLNA